MGKISRYDAQGDDGPKRKKSKAEFTPKVDTPAPPPPSNASKSASNKLRDVKRALAKLAKKADAAEVEADKAHVEALEEKVARLERRQVFNTEEQARKAKLKKQVESNRKATFMEYRKVTKLFKKSETEGDKAKYANYLEYIKRFNANASGKLKYISLFDSKLSEENQVKREEFLQRAQASLEAKTVAKKEEGGDDFFEEEEESGEESGEEE
ncbi:hypothetical protein BASA81_012798 [Batrachochytrium salamandrivorans]|nr:hypothetical protein BASA81_012798 [Batrachochytrium salamandrivorans]